MIGSAAWLSKDYTAVQHWHADVFICQKISTKEVPNFGKRKMCDSRKWFINTEFPSMLE